MNLKDYKDLVTEVDFKEYPWLFIHDKDYLSQIINYDETDIELKIYLSQLILSRSFFGTYTSWYLDVEWFINSFFKDFKIDFVKPALTETIREAAGMIMSEESFTKKIIGTTFMFGIIEFYAKHKLGFRPLDFNFFDARKKEYIKQFNPTFDTKKRDLTIKPAFEYLQKQNLPLSISLNEIDAFTIQRLSEEGIESEGWTVHKIADRLALVRNPIVHGELHSFYDKGPYLLMLYTLFYLHDLNEHQNF